MSTPNEHVNTPELNADIGKQRRYRILVPSPKTHLVLGKEWRDPEKSSPNGGPPPGFGYPGLSATTAENLFLHIHKHSLIQSLNGIFLQTNDTWAQASSREMLLSTPRELRVSGGEVFLGAGGLFDGPSFLDQVGSSIDPDKLVYPDWRAYSKSMEELSSVWLKALSALTLIKTPLTMSHPPDFVGTVKRLVSLWQVSSKAFKFGWNEYLKNKVAPDMPGPNLVAFGTTGILQLSPKDITIASEESVNIKAKGGLSFASIGGASVQSLEGVSIFGAYKSSLESAFVADVKAAMEVGLSSLRGKLKVKGRSISIGGLKNNAQVATETVSIHAPTEKGTIEGLAGQEITLKVGAIEPKLEQPIAKSSEPGSFKDKANRSAQKLGGKAYKATIQKPVASLELSEPKKEVRITVGNFSVVVGESSVQISMNSDSMSDPLIQLDKNGIIMNGGASHRAQFHLNKDGLVVEGGNHASFELGPQRAKVNGRSVIMNGDVIKLG